ncbi:MAG: Rrf2 family transcriptional regulator [Cyclobacteriaceae bacterium]
MFSRACEYAIKIMIYIAANESEGKRTSLKEVTQAIGSPEAFTAKILQQLVRGKLLNSFRGPTGGFVLNGEKEIRLHDVVTTIDGDHLMEDCVLGLNECSSSNPCPVHDKFLKVKETLAETLLSTMVSDQALLKGKRILRN